MTIRVVINGAAGRMGQEITRGLSHEAGIEVVGAVDIKVEQDSITLPNKQVIPFSSNLEAILDSTKPNVVVDFSLARATLPLVRTATSKKINVVIGTTGLSETDLEEIKKSADTYQTGVIVAPNFALGAVLMMHLARIAAKYMDYAEVIELHHQLKADAPSGTAILTARQMVQSRGKPFNRAAGQGPAASRGQDIDGVSVHSVRLPGLMAHQEVIFGTAGQTLSIRHDTINRECYLPGIVIAIKEVSKYKGLVYGLDTLLNL